MQCSNCGDRLEDNMNFCPWCGTRLRIVSGSFIDLRDNNVYETVMIGKQIWMAKNLAYAAEGSKCYERKYGRLYDWKTAKNSCPAGWHLPTNEEWITLVGFAGGIAVAGKKLKSKSGWEYNGNGTDNFGFAALPGGHGDSDGYFEDAGQFGRWWSASECDVYGAYTRGMGYDFDGAYWSRDGKSNLFSVRCLQD